jgi:pSer/pThr/pTyr-binding forkhead associated (FHA) protein
MKSLYLRPCHQAHPDLALEAGVHTFDLTATGLTPVAHTAAWQLQISHDRRGVWLTTHAQAHTVHVNGRPIHQLAMLRPGDHLHIGQHEFQLIQEASSEPVRNNTARATLNPASLLLRGIGGTHHGRSTSLVRPRLIGRATHADLQLDASSIQPEHARIEAHGSYALLTSLADDIWVNGQPVRSALLQNGDQITFHAQHRFVLESPPLSVSHSQLGEHTVMPAGHASPVTTPVRPWFQRIPWLLVVAAIIAIALTALLTVGAHA